MGDRRGETGISVSQFEKTSGEPQVGMILKINGRSDKHLSNEQGVITFQYKIDKSYNRLGKYLFSGR